MELREKLLRGIDVGRATGLEIGALCNPIVSKSDGDIRYVDHASTEDLREKYADDPAVDIERIVAVDYVWGEKTLAQITGGSRFDYIVASHVIEHVPDLVTWVHELLSVLAPGGSIRLAVPDRRFTFDYLRQESRLSDILHAYLQRARRPLPICVLDYHLSHVHVDCVQAWDGTLDTTRLQHKFTFGQAMELARDALDNGAYHDGHCWVFTPYSFADIFEKLNANGLLHVACSDFADTERYRFEFVVAMTPAADRQSAIESWRAVKRRCTDGAEFPATATTAPRPESPEPEPGPGPGPGTGTGAGPRADDTAKPVARTRLASLLGRWSSRLPRGPGS